MKQRIEVVLTTTDRDRYGPEEDPRFHSTSIYLKCNDKDDPQQVKRFNDELTALRKIALKVKETYLKKRLNVDWGTFTFLARENKNNSMLREGSCFCINFKINDYCELQVISPPIHLDGRLLTNPDYSFL